MPVATVGDESSAETTLTAEDVDAFATITGDDNPIHLDEGYASETMFGEQIAHGILSAGVISAAMASLSATLSTFHRISASTIPSASVIASLRRPPWRKS